MTELCPLPTFGAGFVGNYLSSRSVQQDGAQPWSLDLHDASCITDLTVFAHLQVNILSSCPVWIC